MILLIVLETQSLWGLFFGFCLLAFSFWQSYRFISSILIIFMTGCISCFPCFCDQTKSNLKKEGVIFASQLKDIVWLEREGGECEIASHMICM